MARACIHQRVGTGHELHPGRDVDPLESAFRGGVAVINHGHLDVDRDTTEGIDDLPEPVEVDLDVVLDIDRVELAEDGLEPVVAPGLVGPRVHVRTMADGGEPGVDLAGVDRSEQLPGGTWRDRHVDRVAWDLEHGDLVGDRVDRHGDHRVRVVAAALFVGTDQQDVEALGPVPRRNARGGHGRADRTRIGGRGVGRLSGGICGRGRGRVGVTARRTGIEDALRRARKQDVVAGDRDVQCAHDDHDREQPRQRRDPGQANGGTPSRATFDGHAPASRRIPSGEPPGDPPGVDDCGSAVGERHEIDHEQARDEPLLDGEPRKLEDVQTNRDPREQRPDEDRRRRETERTAVGAEIGVPEAGKEEGEERGDEGGAPARTHFVRGLHRG